MEIILPWKVIVIAEMLSVRETVGYMVLNTMFAKYVKIRAGVNNSTK